MKFKNWGVFGILVLLMQSGYSQLAESFNTRQGIKANQIKAYLHNNCWLLNQFEVVPAVKHAAVKGNGVLVSTSPSGASLQTPFLNITDPFRVSFSFRYQSNFYNHAMLKVNLVNEAGEISTLDVVDLPVNGDNDILYDEVFSNTTSGVYKLALSFQQPDDKGMIMLDEFYVTAPLYYEGGGCNTAPLALADVFTGNADRTATGSLSANDRDWSEKKLAAFVIADSKDGKITIHDGLRFSFEPNIGFNGNRTRFSYRVCDSGPGNLCSEETWATIRFEPAVQSLRSGLVDFSGMYLNEGKIKLGWIVSSESESTKYQVERSTDGKNWKLAGELKAKPSTFTEVRYFFEDKVSPNIANKKDLYYRLKQIQNNEVFISRLLVLRVYNTETLKMVSVTPNPVRKDIGMRIDLNEDAFISMKIVNSSGTTQMRRNLKARTGINTYLMDGSSTLIPGVYFLEIIVNSKERMIVSLVKE